VCAISGSQPPHGLDSLVDLSLNVSSTHARNAAIGAAPDCRASTPPSHKSSRVGTARTAKRWDSTGAASTSTLTNFSCPACSWASCSSAGLTIRHGPHQLAHRSTRTGIDEFSAISANVSSRASTIHGSHWWHCAQRGLPAAAAGTRFFRPQWGQVTMRALSVMPMIPSRSQRRFGVFHESSPPSTVTWIAPPTAMSPRNNARSMLVRPHGRCSGVAVVRRNRGRNRVRRSVDALPD
jgi:hypothetical protein